MRTIIVIGNDKIAGRVSEQVSGHDNCFIYIDKSTNISRALKLITKRVISPVLLAKMLICEVLRSGCKANKSFPSIRHNDDLMQAIETHQPERLLLFRAGLIVNKKVINSGVPVLNIHAAIVPDYGGIGSIARAIKDQAYEQYASLHVVTTQIDKGEVIDRIAYRLDPGLTYCQNEEVAYRAAQQLLLKTIRIPSNSSPLK